MEILRLTCSRCGQPVSPEMAVDYTTWVVRAFVECPDCIEKRAAADAKRQEYITNSIDRILMAKCHPSQFHARSMAIMDAMVKAAHGSLQEAHDHLRWLVEQAERGAYQDAI